MANLQPFDYTGIPEGDFEPIPAGDYCAEIISSDVVQSKGSGEDMIKLEIEIKQGEHTGRKLFDYVLMWSANETARKIAYQKLASIAKSVDAAKAAMGQPPLPNPLYSTEPLHFHPIAVTVAIKPASGQYGPGNEIKRYGAMKPQGAPAPRQPAPPQAPPPQQAGYTPPGPAPAPPQQRAPGTLPWH